ncbi:hypothetical protein JTE90_008045 [Oedothorax gibbosus]|uniref:Uncharacterized protein n=1 Tax=Oedothorax gibbosus TaxID=931172 RepID=A0AAV6UY86_9ARAC|nr:hypothetical protein JTE90_008045 [Oedothorax gibbosus]
MHVLKILGAFLVMAVYVNAYGGGFGGGNFEGMGPMGPPKPYSFGYNAADSMGNNHFRKEQSDGNGGVIGSYGYTDKKGLHRVVDYVANAGGYQAKVRTNEPGTDGKENPADVQMQVAHSAAGMQGYGNMFGQGSMGMNSKMIFY